MGFASLVADAMSMGLGDTLSEMAERDFIRREWERETWEMDTNPSGKVQEMQEFYVQKGVSEEDASRILEIFSKYKVFFVEHTQRLIGRDQRSVRRRERDDDDRAKRRCRDQAAGYFSGSKKRCKSVTLGLYSGL